MAEGSLPQDPTPPGADHGDGDALRDEPGDKVPRPRTVSGPVELERRYSRPRGWPFEDDLAVAGELETPRHGMPSADAAPVAVHGPGSGAATSVIVTPDLPGFTPGTHDEARRATSDSLAPLSAPLGSVYGGRARHATTTSPAEAMRIEEVARMRMFLKVAVFIAACAAVAVTFMQHDAMAYRVVLGGCGLVAVGASLLWWTVTNPDRYTTGRITAGATIIAVGGNLSLYFWGVASPATAMVLYGIYFFSLGMDVRVRLVQYAVCVLFHGTLSLLFITGTSVDRSVLPITHLATWDQLTTVGTVQFLYFVAFYTARASRRTTMTAVEGLEQAVRSVAQREALLAEVRAELDRAIRVGGPGRYTEQLVGSFRLGVLIGRGGMGEVYEAFNLTDRTVAAVKLLGAGSLGDDQYLRRFLREAEHAARLDNPHVVKVLEVGATSGELPFIAMERLRGTDLAHQLRRHRRLTLEATVELVTQLASGLEAARDAGLVHRDLKPQNVFRAETAQGGYVWKILDFGVSKAVGSGTLTKGNLVGTPAYMSPEQARGGAIDHRADVYSLAAITYRCVTGHPAFTGKDIPSTLHEVVYRVPTQPSLLAPLHVDVDRVLALGLAKAAEARFDHASEFAAWLAAAVGEGLTVEQRQRADAHIDAYPWGQRLRAEQGQS